jgi:hypothetical protein
MTTHGISRRFVHGIPSCESKDCNAETCGFAVLEVVGSNAQCEPFVELFVWNKGEVWQGCEAGNATKREVDLRSVLCSYEPSKSDKIV